MKFENLLKAKGYNPKSFYKEVGIDRQVIYGYRKGIAKPSIVNIAKIAEKLNVSADELIKSFEE